MLTSIAAIIAFWLLVTPSATPPNVLMSSEAGPCPTSCPRMKAANIYIAWRRLDCDLSHFSPFSSNLSVPFQHGRPGRSVYPPLPREVPHRRRPSRREGILVVSFFIPERAREESDGRGCRQSCFRAQQGSVGRRHPQPPARRVAIWPHFWQRSAPHPPSINQCMHQTVTELSGCISK